MTTGEAEVPVFPLSRIVQRFVCAYPREIRRDLQIDVFREKKGGGNVSSPFPDQSMAKVSPEGGGGETDKRRGI